MKYGAERRTPKNASIVKKKQIVSKNKNDCKNEIIFFSN